MPAREAGIWGHNVICLASARPFGLTVYTFTANRHCPIHQSPIAYTDCIVVVVRMDKDLVEQIAKELAELDLSRVKLSQCEKRRIVATISEYHRKKARIAIRVMDRFRERNNKI
jgi:hypothetical protein